jgi:hypothetical protein
MRNFRIWLAGFQSTWWSRVYSSQIPNQPRNWRGQSFVKSTVKLVLFITFRAIGRQWPPSFDFTFFIGRRTEVHAPVIYRAHWLQCIYLCEWDVYTRKYRSPQDWSAPTDPCRNSCHVWACSVATMSSACCIVAVVPRMLCHKYSCSRWGRMIPV